MDHLLRIPRGFGPGGIYTVFMPYMRTHCKETPSEFPGNSEAAYHALNVASNVHSFLFSLLFFDIMIVVYSSKTGSSEAYARALASRLGCGCFSVKDSIPEGQPIVFVGWLRFDIISGIRSIDRSRLKAVCVVGIDDHARFETSKARIAGRNGVTVPMFHLRGWIERMRLNVIDRTSLAVVAALTKLQGLDNATKPIFDAIMEGGSFYDESQLDSVVRFVSPSASRS